MCNYTIVTKEQAAKYSVLMIRLQSEASTYVLHFCRSLYLNIVEYIFFKMIEDNLIVRYI